VLAAWSGLLSLACGLVFLLHAGGAHGESSPDPLSAAALMGDVRAHAALGADHLTGTTDAAATERWVGEQLKAAGLSVGLEAYRYLRFLPRQVALSIEGAPVESLAARFYSGTTPEQGLDAPLAWGG
jgi:hypothetical protein